MKTKNHIKEAGSALFVTIMITSMVLLVAMVLLERIIPYSREIRSMQDSLQSYYTARGEVELGRLEFLKESGTLKIPSDPRNYSEERVDVDPDHRISSGNPLSLDVPDNSSTKSYVVIAQDLQLPLAVRLFKNDTDEQSFGSSPGDTTSHVLSTFGGGVTFDLSGISTNSNFDLELQTKELVTEKIAGIKPKIAVEFVYIGDDGEIPFFGTVDIDPSGTHLLQASHKNAEGTGNVTLSDELLALKNCNNAHCYMKIRLVDTNMSTVSMTLRTSDARKIPDINAIIVADGLSNNLLYHTRIVELIPVTQSI